MFALWLISAHVLADTLPKAATSVIIQTHKAAKAADYVTLQSLMTHDFIWSFGGDASATQAIAAWKANPSLLDQLHKATRQPCTYLADRTLECPINPGTGYRAGFKNTTSGWRMYYFVQGD